MSELLLIDCPWCEAEVDCSRKYDGDIVTCAYCGKNSQIVVDSDENYGDGETFLELLED